MRRGGRARTFQDLLAEAGFKSDERVPTAISNLLEEVPTTTRVSRDGRPVDAVGRSRVSTHHRHVGGQTRSDHRLAKVGMDEPGPVAISAASVVWMTFFRSRAAGTQGRSDQALQAYARLNDLSARRLGPVTCGGCCWSGAIAALYFQVSLQR